MLVRCGAAVPSLRDRPFPEDAVAAAETGVPRR